MRLRTALAAVIVVLAGCATKSSTSGSSGYGAAGVAAVADRTVYVHITPHLSYEPSTISLPPGDTVIFKVTNDTAAIHQFVLGDQKFQDDYQQLTSTSKSGAVTATPDRANILNIAGGDTKQLVWRFPSASGATVLYGSHEPGDYAGGLMGTITVR